MTPIAQDYVKENQNNRDRVAEYHYQQTRAFWRMWPGFVLALLGLASTAYLGLWNDYHKFEIPAVKAAMVVMVIGAVLIVWGIAIDLRGDKAYHKH